MLNVQLGDLVLSLVGRDKGKRFIVIDVNGDRISVVDGKTHAIQKPKLKNVKHVKKLLSAKFNDVAEKIKSGQSVGNQRIYKLIMAEKQKIQED